MKIRLPWRRKKSEEAPAKPYEVGKMGGTHKARKLEEAPEDDFLSYGDLVQPARNKHGSKTPRAHKRSRNRRRNKAARLARRKNRR